MFGTNNEEPVRWRMNKPEDTTPSPDSGRARRPPPTIDLEASQVSSETRNAAEDAPPEPVSDEPSSHESLPMSPLPRSPSPMSRGADFALGHCARVRRGRRGVGDLRGLAFGWPAVLPATSSAPPLNAAVIDDLAARVADMRPKSASVPRPRRIRPWPIASKRWRNPLLVAPATFKGFACAIGELRLVSMT